MKGQIVRTHETERKVEFSNSKECLLHTQSTTLAPQRMYSLFFSGDELCRYGAFHKAQPLKPHYLKRFTSTSASSPHAWRARLATRFDLWCLLQRLSLKTSGTVQIGALCDARSTMHSGQQSPRAFGRYSSQEQTLTVNLQIDQSG